MNDVEFLETQAAISLDFDTKARLNRIARQLESYESNVPRAWGVWSTVPGGPDGGWWVSDGEDAGNARVFYSPRAAKAWSKGYAHCDVREIGPGGEPMEEEK